MSNVSRQPAQSTARLSTTTDASSPRIGYRKSHDHKQTREPTEELGRLCREMNAILEVVAAKERADRRAWKATKRAAN